MSLLNVLQCFSCCLFIYLFFRPRGMQYLSSLTRDWTVTTCIEKWSLNCCTARGLPRCPLLEFMFKIYFFLWYNHFIQANSAFYINTGELFHFQLEKSRKHKKKLSKKEHRITWQNGQQSVAHCPWIVSIFLALSVLIEAKLFCSLNIILA